LRKSINSEMIPDERLEYEATLSELRANLKELELQAAWTDGEAMDGEATLAYTLADNRN
jgi:hypothetical protein